MLYTGWGWFGVECRGGIVYTPHTHQALHTHLTMCVHNYILDTEMTKYRITIHREPFGKEEKRVTRRGSFSHSYMPEKSRDWMNLIRMTFIEKYGQVMYAGGIKMQIEAYYPIKGSYKHEANVRKNVSKAVKEKMLLNEIRPLVKPDNSNVLKLIEDGLSNACYVDDSQIIENTIKKYFCSKPRLEIYLETV